MKPFILNVNSSVLHKRNCCHSKKLKEPKYRKFYTVDEAIKTCRGIKFCKVCRPEEEQQ